MKYNYATGKIYDCFTNYFFAQLIIYMYIYISYICITDTNFIINCYNGYIYAKSNQAVKKNYELIYQYVGEKGLLGDQTE